MRKIPTLFKRIYKDHQVAETLPEVTEGMEWVLEGEGIATVKYDGACCAIIDGELYKRYDAKHGKKPPEGAIPCQPEPDPVTTHWPHWVKCREDEPSDKWFLKALEHPSFVFNKKNKPYCTDEAIGEHFNGTPYHMEMDMLVPHGEDVIEVERTFEGIKNYLCDNPLEGIVFWKDGEPRCKIKRTDFGFTWPITVREWINKCLDQLEATENERKEFDDLQYGFSDEQDPENADADGSERL